VATTLEERMAPGVALSEHMSQQSIMHRKVRPLHFVVAMLCSLRSITNMQETSLLESSHYGKCGRKDRGKL